MNKKKRAKLIDEIIRDTYISLESHLWATHSLTKKDKKRESCGNEKFHKKCIRKYAKDIYIMTKLY